MSREWSAAGLLVYGPGVVDDGRGLKRYTLINLFLIVISAPWTFVGWDVRFEVLGLPFWVIYALTFTVRYAVFVAFGIERLWRRESEAERGPMTGDVSHAQGIVGLGITLRILRDFALTRTAAAWVVILFVEAVFAAVMPSADSALLLVASSVTQDIVWPAGRI
jgi:Na+/proline symporter